MAWPPCWGRVEPEAREGKTYRTHPVVREALEPLYGHIPAGTIGIHGHLYDAAAFARRHPGGASLVLAAAGQECTMLFETHHVNHAKALALLDSLPRVGSYGEREDEFFDRYRALRARVAPLLRRPVAAGTLLERGAWVVALGALHAVLCTRAPGTGAWVAAVLATAAASTVCGGIGHDALHRGRPLAVLLDWNGLSCFEWMLEHISSHHMHTNTAFDHDVLSMRPFVEWTPVAVGCVGLVGMHLIFLISEVAVALQGLFVHRVRWAPWRRGGFPGWLRVAPLLFPLRLATLMLGQGPLWGALSFFVTVALAGYGFALLAHLNHAPAAYPMSPDDFVLQQLTTTRDIRPFLPKALMLGLDRQTLHHLFPSVDHSLLDDRLRTEVSRALPPTERDLLRPRAAGALYGGMCAAASRGPRAEPTAR